LKGIPAEEKPEDGEQHQAYKDGPSTFAYSFTWLPAEQTRKDNPDADEARD
jgi:hypothetical protein